MDLQFFAESCAMPLAEEARRRVGRWYERTAADENCVPEDLNVIFCSDDYLLEVNRQYLQHDYYTDIITFDDCFEEDGERVLCGDIFISVDTVRANAERFGTTFDDELHRVMIHGLLHLIGYDDKNDAEQERMTAGENRYLAILGDV